MDASFPVEPVEPPSPGRRRLFAVVTVIVIIAFVVVAGLEGSGFVLREPSPPAVAPSLTTSAQARLAYVGPDGSLSVMDAGRASAIQVPRADATFAFPAWSPDSTHVAAIRTDSAGTSVDVFGIPVTGGSTGTPPERVTVYSSATEPAFYLYWAPDSRALAFLTTEPDGLALRRAPADAATPASLVRKGSPMYWQWVDASRLLVHSGGDAADAFAGEVGLDGEPDAAPAIGTGAFRAPAVSRDGTYLASASSGPDGAPTVVVASRDGAIRHDIPVFGLAAFGFDPTGDTLAFIAPTRAGASTDLPVGPLRAVDPASGTVRTLVDGSVVTFFWAPDGRTIAAIAIPGPGDTTTAVTRSRGTATLARAGASAVQAAAGAVLQVTFVDAVSGAVRGTQPARLSDLFISQVLPYFDQYALSHRFWAPDGTSLVLPTVDEQGTTRITTFRADGADPVDLVDGLFAAWSP